MPKLSDTQLVILSTAANRDDHSILPLPASLKDKSEAGTKRTISALIRKTLIEERSCGPDEPAWRADPNAGNFALYLTEAGLAIIDGGPATQAQTRPAGIDPEKNADLKPTGKHADIARLIKRRKGATIADLVIETGWQAHSVRGAISGALKHKYGMNVISAKEGERGRVYRIGAEA